MLFLLRIIEVIFAAIRSRRIGWFCSVKGIHSKLFLSSSLVDERTLHGFILYYYDKFACKYVCVCVQYSVKSFVKHFSNSCKLYGYIRVLLTNSINSIKPKNANIFISV